MARLLVVSDPAAQTPLPGLALLAHTVTMVDGQEAALAASGNADLVVLDARSDLSRARGLGLLFAADAPGVPVLLVITQGALGLVSRDWGISDFVLAGADPAELDARIRMLLTANPVMSTITSTSASIAAATSRSPVSVRGSAAVYTRTPPSRRAMRTRPR